MIKAYAFLCAEFVQSIHVVRLPDPVLLNQTLNEEVRPVGTYLFLCAEFVPSIASLGKIRVDWESRDFTRSALRLSSPSQESTRA